MKSQHEVALEIAALIREALLHNDGMRPCVAGVLDPRWVAGRANNIATAISLNYDLRPLAVSGEIETRDPITGETPEEMARRLIK